VFVPIDAAAIRVITDKLEEIPAGGSAMLVFKNGKLESALPL